MRKQTKLVAVLSATALLALGASMTSFAAGWEKDEAGIWHYYDSDDDMVTGEWKKDGGKWFYLDDDGDMLTDHWVDDEYYVGSDGAMLVNAWYYGFADDEDQDSPEDDGEHWYYFGSKGKRIENDRKKINGKTYYFNDDGQMRWGWYQDGDDVYYLGDEMEGWRAENQWLWLEKSGLAEEDDDDMNEPVLGCSDEDVDHCDDEGWYWFQSSGKMYHDTKKKKINGNFFVFNEHGQMLYEWINNGTKKLGSWAQLDGVLDTASDGKATIGEMLYYRENGSDSIDGSRPTGWFKIDGSEDVGTDSDTDWYYIKKGEAKHASRSDDNQLTDGKDDNGNPVPVYRKREKIDGKWFVFNEKGQMKDGLQLVDGEMYYFNSDGYQQTGKVANVEEEDGDYYNYYFTTKNAGNGKGYTGEKDGYLYWMGKRLEADDDYKIYLVNGDYYIVNTKGKCQKSTSKKYDLDGANGKTYSEVKFNTIGKKSFKINVDDAATYTKDGVKDVAFTSAMIKNNACVPHIELLDNWIVEDVTRTSGYYVADADAFDTEFLDYATAKANAPAAAATASDEDDVDDEE